MMCGGVGLRVRDVSEAELSIGFYKQGYNM